MPDAAPPSQSAAPSRLAPLAAALLTGLGMLLGWWFFVDTRRGQLVDTLAYKGADIGSWRVGAHADRLLRETVSVPAIALGIAVVVLVALAQRRRLLAAVAAVSIVAANVSTQVLKYLVLPRPQLVELPGLNHNSYPSGHTTAAASMMVAAVLVAPRVARPLVSVVGAAVMVAFGWSTLAAHWHRPSDVVGAYLVCLAWGCVAVFVLAAWRPGTHDRRPAAAEVAVQTSGPGAGRATALLLVVAGSVALGIAVWCLWQSRVVVDVMEPTRREQFVAYLGGSAGLSGVAVGAMGVLLWLVDAQHRATARP